jgi:hypothetical protein
LIQSGTANDNHQIFVANLSEHNGNPVFVEAWHMGMFSENGDGSEQH